MWSHNYSHFESKPDPLLQMGIAVTLSLSLSLFSMIDMLISPPVIMQITQKKTELSDGLVGVFDSIMATAAVKSVTQ
jgi:hypothetical protein